MELSFSIYLQISNLNVKLLEYLVLELFHILDILLHQKQTLEPGIELLARSIGGMMQFRNIEDTSFWMVQVDHADSAVALRWLGMIYAEADDLLRDQDRTKLQNQLQYLRLRLQNAELSSLRAGLFSALISQEKSLHMMESGLPYAADIIEPAYASALKTKPNLMKTIGVPAGGAAFGHFVGDCAGGGVYPAGPHEQD